MGSAGSLTFGKVRFRTPDSSGKSTESYSLTGPQLDEVVRAIRAVIEGRLLNCRTTNRRWRRCKRYQERKGLMTIVYQELRGTGPTMVNSVVLFLDLLGYKDLIAGAVKTHREQDLLRHLHRALVANRDELAPGSLDPEDVELFRLRAFTDNVVVGWPVQEDGEGELGTCLVGAAQYQFALIRDGLFTRGGIAVGLHWMDEYAVFGQALTESYLLESQNAVQPRVALGTTAMTAVRRQLSAYASISDAPHFGALLRDNTVWFLDYLKVVCSEQSDSSFDPDVCEEILNAHCEQIKQKLSKHAGDPKVASKYEWAAHYHNFICDELSHVNALRAPVTSKAPTFQRLP